MSRLAQYRKIKTWKNLFNFKSDKSLKERFNRFWKKAKPKKSWWEKTKLLFNPEITPEPKDFKEKLLGLKPFRDFKEKLETQKQEKKLLKEFDEIKELLDAFDYEGLPEELQERAKSFHDLAYQIGERRSYDYDKSLQALENLLLARTLFLSSVSKKN